MDPLQHPDLQRLGRRLRDRLEETLDAEQHAAYVASQRRSSLRDRLSEAEDRASMLVLCTADGRRHRGRIAAVGVDHVVLNTGDADRWISLAMLVAVEPQ